MSLTKHIGEVCHKNLVALVSVVLNQDLLSLDTTCTLHINSNGP